MNWKKAGILVIVMILIAVFGLGPIARGGKWLINSVGGLWKSATQEVERTLSLADLQASGNDLKCIYTSNTAESGKADITVFISGKKMRANSTGISREEIPFDSSMLVINGQMYVWTPGQKDGVKMSVGGTGGTQQKWRGQAGFLDPEQKMDYECEDWEADINVFSIPGDVNFEDMAEIVHEQCVVCESLTVDQRDVCKQSLGCEQ